MRHELLIFDFDGTIADTREMIVRTFRMTMAELGMRMASPEECAATIGLPLEEGFMALFPEIGREGGERCAATYRRIFEENKKELSPALFPGVRETLRELKGRGHTLTIASSRHREGTSSFLSGYGLLDLFSLVLGAGDVRKAKPDPEPVLKTLDLLGFQASDALVIGDMPFDILMGKRAGADTCGVTYGNATKEDLRAAGAVCVIDSFKDLLGIA